MNKHVAACLLPAVLTGCPTPPAAVSPIAAYGQAVLNELAEAHQFELRAAAIPQAPVMAMQQQPVLITPNPVAPPVTVTPVVPTPVPPVVGSGGPVVTPSARYRRHSHQFDDNPPATAAALNAAQLSQLMLAAAQ
jgi:hypothetical protein